MVRHRQYVWVYAQIEAQRETVRKAKLAQFATDIQRVFRGFRGRRVAKIERGELPYLRLRDIAATVHIQRAVRKWRFR